ncbi:MAG: aminoacyl-tRNA hydrolase [Lachnospiraceae bacterium]|nr:aminoacyl-tRNA hydrolase [Lachnospiraceae bacterium]
MFIIAGLGNPTDKYTNTRHNVGFRVIDELAERNNIPLNNKKFKAVCGSGVIGGNKVLLLKPQTYMNLSGESIREAMDFYKIDPETELLVIYDDISLDVGQLRIRAKGSAGGHNGIKSIIAHAGTQTFLRVKVGVGEKPAGFDLADYVLSVFPAEERETIQEGIADAAKATELMLNDGIEAAMNQYNKKKQS